MITLSVKCTAIKLFPVASLLKMSNFANLIEGTARDINTHTTILLQLRVKQGVFMIIEQKQIYYADISLFKKIDNDSKKTIYIYIYTYIYNIYIIHIIDHIFDRKLIEKMVQVNLDIIYLFENNLGKYRNAIDIKFYIKLLSP
jgi:uncharacterized LabA/DUF88 family protein